METIREKRYSLRNAAASAMYTVQQFEGQLVNALEKIRGALGLAKDAQPEQIAEAAENALEQASHNESIWQDIQGVLSNNGITGLMIVDAVRALAGRAKTALADQKILAERNVAVSAENVKLVTELEELKRDRDSWIRTANEFSDGSSYYRALLVKIGELFGQSAKTSDDGSIQQDVLVAKVPELVQRLFENNAKQTTPTPGYEQACKSQWRRSPGGDVSYSRVGPLSCWYRPDVGLRWTHKDWLPKTPWTSLDLPGYSAAQVMGLRKDQTTEPPQDEQKPEWRRVPSCDTRVSIGFLHCWHSPAVGYRWWFPGVTPSGDGSGVDLDQIQGLQAAA